MNTIQRLLATILLVGLPMQACSQNILSIGNGSALPGDNVSIGVQITHDDPVLGFSFGAVHDGAVLTPTSLVQGAALAPLNGGTGAEYFFEDLAPANGPGVVLACIFTFGGVLDSLPPGADQEVAVINYTVSPSATPGSSTAVSPSTALGVPPINIVFTVGGVSVFPSTTAGSASVEVPAPSGLTNTLADICSCSYDFNWTNNASYTGIQVRLLGSLVATLPGSATSATVILPASTADVCVTGVIGPASSAQTCVDDSCPGYSQPPPPSGLSCSILDTDPVSGCTVDASWTNPGGYSSIDVFVNGILAESIPSNAVAWQGALSLSPDAQDICIEATDACGGVLAQVCCQLTCTAGPIFIRGDCNADSLYNIADVVAALSFLFGGAGPPPCGDACDINDDGAQDISDPVFLLSNLFSSGNFPPAPYPDCGEDPTEPDGIDCSSFPPCP